MTEVPRRRLLAGAMSLTVMPAATWMLAAPAACTLAAPAAGAAPAALRAPIDVARRRALVGRALPRAACPAPIPAERDVRLGEFYSDRANSVIDPIRLRQYQESVRAFGTFSVTVARQSDIWLGSDPAQPAAAACALAWLDRWASGGAMLGDVNGPGGEHERKWALAGAAQAYLKIREAPGLDPDARRRVERWFVDLATASRAYYAQWRRTSYNNHIYWLALALAATGVAAGERTLWDGGIGLYRMALDDIAEDGSLRLELERKGRALDYHIFSLMPLVMLAEFGQANGLDLYGERGGALHRLARRVQDGLADPSWFAARAGTAQEDDHPAQQPRNLSWAEPYHARFPNPVLAGLLAPRRPIFYHWMGGDVTADYGAPALNLR